jgi:hypothetical protein
VLAVPCRVVSCWFNVASAVCSHLLAAIVSVVHFTATSVVPAIFFVAVCAHLHLNCGIGLQESLGGGVLVYWVLYMLVSPPWFFRVVLWPLLRWGLVPAGVLLLCKEAAKPTRAAEDASEAQTDSGPSAD